MNRVTRIISATLVIAVVGCESTVEIDYPNHAPSIVINSFFSPAWLFELHLSDARSLDDGIDAVRCIENASVDLLQDGQFVETIPYVGDCLYRSPSSRPRPGPEYTVRVSADRYESVEASDRVPSHVPVGFEYHVFQSGRVDVTVRLRDPIEEENWYRLMTFIRFEDELGNVWFVSPGFRTDDEAIVAENALLADLESDNVFDTAFFTDKRLTAGEHEFKIEVHPEGFVSDNVKSTLVVTVDAISETFFDYGTTVRLQNDAKENPFTEPVLVVTNVKHGFGIFAGMNRERLDVAISSPF